MSPSADPQRASFGGPAGKTVAIVAPRAPASRRSRGCSSASMTTGGRIVIDGQMSAT
jgi:hypothetical protein